MRRPVGMPGHPEAGLPTAERPPTAPSSTTRTDSRATDRRHDCPTAGRPQAGRSERSRFAGRTAVPRSRPERSQCHSDGPAWPDGGALCPRPGRPSGQRRLASGPAPLAAPRPTPRGERPPPRGAMAVRARKVTPEAPRRQRLVGGVGRVWVAGCHDRSLSPKPRRRQEAI